MVIMSDKNSIRSATILPPDFDYVARMSNRELGLYIRNYRIKIPECNKVALKRGPHAISVHYFNDEKEVFSVVLKRVKIE